MLSRDRMAFICRDVVLMTVVTWLKAAVFWPRKHGASKPLDQVRIAVAYRLTMNRC